MAIYSIDLTSQASIISSLQTGLATAGIISTVHYNTSPNLLVTLSCWTKPIKFNAPGNGRIYSYFGSSYASSANLNDTSTINAYILGTGVSSVLVVTGDVVAVLENRGGSTTVKHVFAKLNDAGTTEIAWGIWYPGRSGSTLWNADLASRMEAVGVRGAILTTGGNYYQSDILCLDGAYTQLATGVVGLKMLHRATGIGASHLVAGDDVVFEGGGCNSNDYYFPNCFLIEDGNSWAPAA